MIAITLLDEMMKNMSSRLNDLKTYYAIFKRRELLIVTLILIYSVYEIHILFRKLIKNDAVRAVYLDLLPVHNQCLILYIHQ